MRSNGVEASIPRSWLLQQYFPKQRRKMTVVGAAAAVVHSAKECEMAILTFARVFVLLPLLLLLFWGKTVTIPKYHSMQYSFLVMEIMADEGCSCQEYQCFSPFLFVSIFENGVVHQ